MSSTDPSSEQIALDVILLLADVLRHVADAIAALHAEVWADAIEQIVVSADESESTEG